jgi:hypothetical protein
VVVNDRLNVDGGSTGTLAAPLSSPPPPQLAKQNNEAATRHKGAKRTVTSLGLEVTPPPIYRYLFYVFPMNFFSRAA